MSSASEHRKRKSMHDGQATPISAYLQRIDRFPLLSAAEERELARAWHDRHDRTAAQRLALANLRFVVKIAFEYRAYGIRLLDLIQEGNLGLLVAVDRFDPGRNVRLTTYAVWWIRAYIQEYIRRSWSMVRFGTTRAEQRCFYQLRRERQKLERSGEKADPERLARALGVPLAELERIETRITRRDLSLDDPAYTDADETRGERIADEEPGPEARVAGGEASELARAGIRRALETLDGRERAIIERRYLRGGDRAATLRELGAALGISGERVRQLEARAKAKMRAELGPLRELAMAS
jgi:RNA polymerase sigma-32 factor